MYYIFNTEQEAEQYDKDVTALSNFKHPTINWAKPIKHHAQNKWAILCNKKVVLEEQATLDSLPSDWFPTVEEL